MTSPCSLSKASRLALAPSLQLLADSGYQGVKKWHTNSRTPHKKTKKKPITAQQKQQNHVLAQERILCENILGDLKRFAILRGPYRNRTRRFALRFNLIDALQNLHL